MSLIMCSFDCYLQTFIFKGSFITILNKLGKGSHNRPTHLLKMWLTLCNLGSGHRYLWFQIEYVIFEVMNQFFNHVELCIFRFIIEIIGKVVNE